MYILCCVDHAGTPLHMLVLLPETIPHIFIWLMLVHDSRQLSCPLLLNPFSSTPGESFILSYLYALTTHWIIMYFGIFGFICLLTFLVILLDKTL